MEQTSRKTFLSLLSAGLWPDVKSTDCRNQRFTESVEWEKVYQIAEEQSVQGLVLQGLEWYKENQPECIVNIPQDLLLQWIGEVQAIEQQNSAMNGFVAQLNKRLWQNNIYSLLVKGQGVAQCYERPLWRISGDVDLLLDEKNYEKAKKLLIPLADEVHDEDIRKKHQAIIIKDYDVELHGKMPFGLSRKADKVFDTVINDSLKYGGARVWTVNNTDIYMPNADNDVIIVFLHYLRHFFIEGVGLRQICDWCRLLWTYRDLLNHGLLESRLKKAGLISEWQAFGTMAVEYLGMPVEAMPFYKDSPAMRWSARKVLERIMKCGNFGHNNDVCYRGNCTDFLSNVITFSRRMKDFVQFSFIFPMDAPIFFVTYVKGKL